MENSAIAGPLAPAAPPPGSGPVDASRSNGAFARHMRRAEERPEPTAAPRAERRSPAPNDAIEPARLSEAGSTPDTQEETPSAAGSDAVEAGAEPTVAPPATTASAPPPPEATAADPRAVEPDVTASLALSLPDSPAAAVPISAPTPAPAAVTLGPATLADGQAKGPASLTATATPHAEAPVPDAPGAATNALPSPPTSDVSAAPVPAASPATDAAAVPAPPATALASPANAPASAAAPTTPVQASAAPQIMAATAPATPSPIPDVAERGPTRPDATGAAPAVQSTGDRGAETRRESSPAGSPKRIDAALPQPGPEAAPLLPLEALPGEPSPAGDGLASPVPAALPPAPAGEAAPGIVGPPAPAGAPATALPTTLTEPPRAAPPAPPARQIAPLATALASGTRDGEAARISVSLDPGELGRVEISVERSGGQTAIRVTAERAETLALLQRDQRELGQSLTQAGVDESGRSISFSLSGQGGGQRQGQPPPGQHGAALPWTTAADPHAAGLPDSVRPRVARSLLDLAL